MFNPVYPLTMEVLQATIDRGCIYFVRNTYPQAFNPLDDTTKGYFIITHYNNQSKAQAHYNSIDNDEGRFLYDWENPEHQERLKTAASNPIGYKIYSTYFYPDYKKKITDRLKEKINRYMYRHTNWKPEKGDIVNVDFYLHFGRLFVTMSFAGQQLKVPFIDIENQK